MTTRKGTGSQMMYMIYTKTRAIFDNEADAQKYCARLRQDDPYARVGWPRRDANEGAYVVTLSKCENVQEGT